MATGLSSNGDSVRSQDRSGSGPAADGGRTSGDVRLGELVGAEGVQALEALFKGSGHGLLVKREGAGGWVFRAITAGANVTVGDGDGDGGNPVVAATGGGGGGGGGFEPGMLTLEDDFIEAGVGDVPPERYVRSGPPVQMVGYPGTGHPGAVRHRHTVFTQSNFYERLTPWRVGHGPITFEAMVRMDPLPAGDGSSDNLHSFNIGLMEGVSGLNQAVTMRVMRTNSGMGSGAMVRGRVNDGANANTDAEDALVLTTPEWVWLRMEIDADGDEVEFFANGVNVGKLTSNIPKTEMRFRSNMWFFSGATNVLTTDCLVDWVRIRQELQRPAVEPVP